MSKADICAIIGVIMIMIWCLFVIYACLKVDRYINELEEKANKYDLIVNNVEVKDE